LIVNEHVISRPWWKRTMRDCARYVNNLT